MKPPLFKKEIHFRLLRRIGAACLLAMLLTIAALLYLEYRRLADNMLRDAEHQSGLFAGVVALTGRTPEALPPGVTEHLLRDALEQSSFIQVTVTTADQRTLFSGDREDGAARAAAFAATAPPPFASETAAGRLHFSDKRFYRQVLIPLRDARSHRVIGYLNGLYRLSLDDTTATLRWSGLTAALACAALAVLGLLFYPAMVLLQRQLIAGSGEANRAAGFLLKKLAKTLAAADAATSAHHQHRLVVYAASLAKQQRVARTTIRGLIQAAFLHGLDRQGRPDEVVSKREEQQHEISKKWAAAHKRLLKEIKRYRWLREAEPIVRSCREHYDGTGYPAGLSGQAIPIGARILAIVEHFDALTVPGPGRDPVDLAKGLHSIEQESGLRFDPVLVSAFVAMAPNLFTELASLDEAAIDRRVDGVIKGYLPF
jgi:HD-GYP domain-containing protein (c-di-GMP phosphodiesterase class II)